MNPTEQGLSNVAQIEELADQLSDCADEIHVRLMRDIKARQGTPASDAEQALARSLLDDELMLRQRADGMYADAAALVVASLAASQQQVVALTAAAAEKIRKIATIGDALGLVAGLLMLAGAAGAGQPAAIVLALQKIAHQVKALDALQPTKPA